MPNERENAAAEASFRGRETLLSQYRPLEQYHILLVGRVSSIRRHRHRYRMGEGSPSSNHWVTICDENKQSPRADHLSSLTIT